MFYEAKYLITQDLGAGITQGRQNDFSVSINLKQLTSFCDAPLHLFQVFQLHFIAFCSLQRENHLNFPGKQVIPAYSYNFRQKRVFSMLTMSIFTPVITTFSSLLLSRVQIPQIIWLILSLLSGPFHQADDGDALSIRCSAVRWACEAWIKVHGV